MIAVPGLPPLPEHHGIHTHNENQKPETTVISHKIAPQSQECRVCVTRRAWRKNRQHLLQQPGGEETTGSGLCFYPGAALAAHGDGKATRCWDITFPGKTDCHSQRELL